jgi:transcriptional regulator with XRE-family HTH domain
MTPFGSFLHSLRTRHGIRQKELADIIGYEQTYISALELGRKGPPNKEFIDRLIETLGLSAEDSQYLRDAADASQRKFIINEDVSQDVYWMMRDLRLRLPELNSAQIDLIRFALDLKENFKEQPKKAVYKLNRRRNENKLEAYM